MDPRVRTRTIRGAYISYEAPLDILPHLNFWIRAGFANGHAQPVAGYLGGGVVEKGAISGRQNDRIGFAIAHAIIGDTAADAFGLHRAETSFELTYQAILGRNFVVQPNFAFVHHPTGATRAPDSLGVGLRFVFVTAYPIKMEASDPGDPTIPPDGSLVPSD